MAPDPDRPDAEEKAGESCVKRTKKCALFGILWRTLLRRAGSSLILSGVMLAATLASIILCGLQARQETAMAEMVRDTQIRCIVTNAKGSGVDDLGVASFYVDMLVGLRHSRDCFLDEAAKDVQALARENLAQPAGAEICRIYTAASAPELLEINGGAVTFYDGWSADCLMGSEPVCLVTEDLLSQAQEDDGGKSYLTITRRDGTETALQVIGTVSGQMSRRVYCPFYTSLQDGAFEAFPLTSCSFSIRSNQHLEESKQALYEYFAHPSPAASNSYLNAGLLVQDEIYLKSLKRLKDNLAILRIILPALVVITGCVGFLSAYLTNRRRKKELAVMRCIGIKRSGVFRQVFFEQSLLAVCGCGSGILLGFLLKESFFSATYVILGTLLAVNLLGAAIAALQISSVNVMKLMKVEE